MCKNIVFVFGVVFAFSTMAMASDIAFYVGGWNPGWYDESQFDHVDTIITETGHLFVDVQQFDDDQFDDFGAWVDERTDDGVMDIIWLNGCTPSVLYGLGNADPDGSRIEEWLDGGNMIINIGDWFGYVSYEGGARSVENAANGAANILDLSSGIIVSADGTTLTVTPTGHEYMPSLRDTEETDRPVALSQVVDPWEVAAVFASTDGTDTGAQADPVVIHNTETDGYLAIINQDAGPWLADRGLACAEFIGNWVVEQGLLGAGNPYARSPDPRNGAMLAATWYILEWKPGVFAVSHDVYMGDNFDDVNDGAADTFRGNQPLTSTTLYVGFIGSPYPDGLVPDTTYYWRIDEVNDTDPNSPWKGPVWSFWIPPRIAYEPKPTDGVKFVNPDVELNWSAGLGAGLHYVYFGDNFDDVNSADGAPPQTDTTYTPAGPLEIDKTYYWRVDEFDFTNTHKGDVWSFNTMPEIAITDENLVGWWTLDEGMGTNAVDWSGHGRHGTFVGAPQWADGYHGAALEFSASGQYVDCGVDAGQEVTSDFTIAAWVKLAPNNAGHYGGIGGKLVRIGGADYMGFAIVRHSSNVFRLWVGDGTDDLAKSAVSSDVTYTDTDWHHVTGVREGQINALYVDGVKQSETSVTDIVPSEEFFHIGRQYSHLNDRYFRGLIDDVRLYNQALNQEGIQLVMRGDPLLAWGPKPSQDSTLYIREATPLNWSPGDNASQHDVYFGIDRDAVADANASDTTGVYRGRQVGTSYTPPDVEWGGGPYYWRIDEYNTDATISEGGIWRFTVTDFIGIDDFEDYNDFEPDRIFDTWMDGWGVDTNGAEVGYADPNFLDGEHHVETTIVHGGFQSMPYLYENNFKYSEAVYSPTQSDWTEEGVEVLSLWFYGDTANAAERMYVALNGGTAVYHDNANASQIEEWTEWTIDLQAFTGVGLTNVNRIAIGFGDKNNLQAGGTGMVFFDDIRLYRLEP